MEKENLLPFICEDHPDAKVLHSWDEVHTVLNGMPSGVGVEKNHEYCCSVCLKRLSPPKKESPNPL